MHHIGKVLNLYRGDGKAIVASDASVQAHIVMWDDNNVLITVHPSLGAEIKAGDFVLARYAQPEPMVIKILRGKEAEKLWEEFRKFHERRAKERPHRGMPPMPVDLDIPEDAPPISPMPMVR